MGPLQIVNQRGVKQVWHRSTRLLWLQDGTEKVMIFLREDQERMNSVECSFLSSKTSSVFCFTCTRRFGSLLKKVLAGCCGCCSSALSHIKDGRQQQGEGCDRETCTGVTM